MLNLKRTVKNLLAHLFGQGVTIFGTILIPWLCLANWSAQEFGYWVMASAVAQFFVISDLGLSSALANYVCLDSSLSLDRIRQKFSLGARVIARRFAIAMIIALAVAFIYFKYLESTKVTNAAHIALIMYLLSIATATLPVDNLFGGLMRARGRNSLGIFINNFSRLAELSTLAVAVYLGADLLAASLVVFLARCIISSILSISIVQIKSLNFDSNYKPVEIAWDVKKSGWGFTANFVALNVSLHGMVLVASAGGPAVAASFSAARTASRIPGQPIGIAFSSVTPELTTLFATGRYSEFWRVGLWMAAGASSFAFLVGATILNLTDWLETHWLHGKLALDKPVLFTLVIAMFFHVVWQAGAQVLASINKTLKVGFAYLVISVIGIMVATSLWPYFGSTGISVVWLLLEILMIVVVGGNIASLTRRGSI